ncbi:hypothetical protein ACQ4PT_046471 [Festuca glaucescens]
MDEESLLLYCDEDPFADDSTPPPPAAAISPSSGGGSNGDGDHAQQAVDLNLVMEHKSRERCYAPARSTGYLHRLLHHDHHRQHGGVSGARSKAVRYIIYAFGRLGLAAATAFNAVNYLDRFLSIHCNLSWEVWMVELLSVACLSVACKLDEVRIPSLHDLQLEEVMSHSFRASAIGDMELALLKALQWRLACITPYSYLDLLSLPTTASNCTSLLLRSLSDPSFLRFDASVLAAAALRCVPVLQDHAHLIAPQLCQQLYYLRPLHSLIYSQVPSSSSEPKTNAMASPKLFLLIGFITYMAITTTPAAAADGRIHLIIVNNCAESVWPGILATAGHTTPQSGGFHLGTGEETTFDVPVGWSGRVWPRRGCSFDSRGLGSCATGDCGGVLRCAGAGGAIPATVVEMTLGTRQSPMHFYDVSLVDGFNAPVSMTPVGGGRGCGVASCGADLNVCCPSALEVRDREGKVAGCRSACRAMGGDKYCCTGEYGTPAACKPTIFSHLFKAICPKAYSYAFDDASSLNRCKANRYLITFCPPQPE